jgi:hypothetical protein
MGFSTHGWKLNVKKVKPLDIYKSYVGGSIAGAYGYAKGIMSSQMKKKEEDERKEKIEKASTPGAPGSLGSLGEQLYGQSFDESGKNVQDAMSRYKEKVNGNDPITEALKQQRQQAGASAARNFAGRGVAGGVAAAGQEQAVRQKDIDVAASAYQQNSQNLKDYTNMSANIAANQGMLQQTGQAQAIAANPVKPQKGLFSEIYGDLI